MVKKTKIRFGYYAIISLTMVTITKTPCNSLANDKVQKIILSGKENGPRFDGIGVVSGGGATLVLLKDYPAQQRNEILDMVYKPQFGASVSSLLVEIPGDGNSTQGSMPSHSHYRGDCNFSRGYMWWVMKEAKKRNPSITLDGTAWSAPGWVGGGNFWSQDAADYYVTWLRGLREIYGLEQDAIGCRNEKGWNAEFAKILRRTLNDNGFANVKLHAFDNWGKPKLDFLDAMTKDKELADAIDIVSAHTFGELPITSEQRAILNKLGKPLWNSEDHVYKKDFDCLISIVKAFNENYIQSGVTKVINWYDIAGVYPMEPYSCDPAMLLAQEPWSGHYRVRKALWGYAHYGQFTEVGWIYVNSGCKHLNGGGTMVTLKNPKTNDYSIIIETKRATTPQTVSINLTKGMSHHKLCVWQSNEKEQFIRQNDILPKNNYTITLQPNSVYSLSTTSGQMKGSFADIPSSIPFPIPYSDNFDSYTHPEQWGYLPHYTADIIGAFEITDRPDHKGKCIRQMVGERANSWAPDWHYYTIIGDSAWHDYEISADIWLNPHDEAGIMGRVCHVGSGYGIIAKGYYMKINDQGVCQLVITRGKKDKKKLVGDAEQQALIAASKDQEEGGEAILDSSQLQDISSCQWHHMTLRFEGNIITGYIDGKQVVSTVSDRYQRGMARLIAPLHGHSVSTPYFDNLSIRPLGNTPTVNAQNIDIQPLY